MADVKALGVEDDGKKPFFISWWEYPGRAELSRVVKWRKRVRKNGFEHWNRMEQRNVMLFA